MRTSWLLLRVSCGLDRFGIFQQPARDGGAPPSPIASRVLIAMNATATASVKELMAAFLARDMQDGEEIFVGTNLPVIRAGALLAHLHHGPNMRVMVAHTRTNLYDTPVMEHFE